MSKRGRHRKQGARYACGKLKPQVSEGVSPTQWQRICTDAVKLTNDPRLESELGRLVFHGRLTKRQADAASKIARIYGAYERAHGLSRSSRSPDYEMGMLHGAASASDSAFADSKFMKLRAAIPWVMRGAVEQLCVEGSPINPTFLPHMAKLLENIATKHFQWGSQSARNNAELDADFHDEAAARARAIQDRAAFRAEISERRE